MPLRGSSCPLRGGVECVVHGTPGSRIGWRLPFPQGHVSSGSRTSPGVRRGRNRMVCSHSRRRATSVPDGGVDPGLDHQVEGQVGAGCVGC